MNLKNIFFSSEIHPFVAFPVQKPEWLKIIQTRKFFPCNRELLVKRLLKQNEINLTDKVHQNIQLLLEPNSFTITTGHQLCYGTGPLYVIYKTLSVIELCEKLKEKYPEYHFIPIFWLASEDHDYLEVNHFYVDYQNKIEYWGDFQGAVGRHTINQSLIQYYLWVTEPYLKHDNWKNAFQELLSTIFKDFGLVFIDGDDLELKKSFSSFFLKELLERPTYKNVTQTNESLRKLNIKIQWNVTPVNLFYLTETKREKIHYQDGSYFIGNEKVELNKIVKEVLKNPEKLSPSAGIRPMYQEYLLPNLAYIGGWSEIRYWLQLKTNFEEFQIFYPILLPRFSYTYVPEEIEMKILGLGYDKTFLLKPLKEIQRTIASKYYDFEDFKNHFFSLHQNISNLQEEIKDLSESLVYSLETQKYYWNKIYLQLEKKLIKQIQNQYPKEFFEVYSLKDKVQPEGFIQERTLNISAFVKEKNQISYFMEKLSKDLAKWVEVYI